MELPRAFPYSPSLRDMALTGLFFGGSAWFMGYQAMQQSHRLVAEGTVLGQKEFPVFPWCICGLCAALALLPLVALWRRQFHPRVLELGQDTLVLPHGPLQWRVARIPFTEIAGLQERKVHGYEQLVIHTEGEKFEMAESLFPCKKSYAEVRDFLTRRMHDEPEQAPL